MSLRTLVPGGDSAVAQATSLSLDVLGRTICNTWDEAIDSGGAPFTHVVVGSGQYGAYVAAKLVARNQLTRVLVLEAGPFLTTEHVQNIGDVGLNVPSAISPAADPGIAREFVWGLPWRGNTDFPGLAYCCGGKSLYWGGWCPRLTPDDRKQWPAEVATYLDGHYADLERETGVTPGTDFISGPLLDALMARTRAAAPAVTHLDVGLDGGPVQEAPIAVQGSAPVSGLFSFDKYSSLPLLIEAIRADIRAARGADRDRRIFLVPRAHVVRIHAEGGAAKTIEVDNDGRRRFLPLGGAAVVLAASTIESTRLALLSFPTPLMGRNLRAHVRSDFAFRVRRSVLPVPAGPVQTAALLVRGLAAHGRFHLQLTASDNRSGSDALLYQMLPDVDLLDLQLANSDPDWISLTIRGIGEMGGDRLSSVPNETGSWMNLSPYENDEYGVPRAYVHLTPSPEDLHTWSVMDQTALDLAQGIAGDPGNIEYQYDGDWRGKPHPLDRPSPPWHWGLGTTYHEAGTMWMGHDPTTSVTDPTGRLHHVENVYVADQSTFPTVGSANPVLTGLTLARHLAERLA